MHIPYPITITDSASRPVQLTEAEVVLNEIEVIQQADQAIYGKSIVDATLDLIHKQQWKNQHQGSAKSEGMQTGRTPGQTNTSVSRPSNR